MRFLLRSNTRSLKLKKYTQPVGGGGIRQISSSKSFLVVLVPCFSYSIYIELYLPFVRALVKEEKTKAD